MKAIIQRALKLLWPTLAVITILIFSLVPYQSQWIEQYYSRGLFQAYRIVWDTLLSWSPIPLIYVLLIVVVGLIIRRVIKLSAQEGQWFVKIGAGLMTMVNIVSVLILLFYWCWGFNYKRVSPLAELIQTNSLPSEEELFLELESVTKQLVELRQLLPDSMDWAVAIRGHESEYRDALTQVFDRLDKPYHGKVRARLIYPKGSLLHFSTAGVYLPFIGEGHIDPGLHPITWPATMTHEMSHGYGYTSEDLCNFWALLACVNSGDPVMQYSGYFSYWRYLRSNAYLANNDRYKEFSLSIPQIILHDLEEVISYSDRYVDILPKLRDIFYDSYLKSHGISDGLKNYSRIIVLAHQWKTEHGSFDLRQMQR